MAYIAVKVLPRITESPVVGIAIYNPEKKGISNLSLYLIESKIKFILVWKRFKKKKREKKEELP